NDAATGHSVNNLTLESLNLRQVRRGAAGFNHQRIESTGALGKRGRGASNQSVVEPARRRFVPSLSLAFCFLRDPLASSTYARSAGFWHPRRGLPSPGNRPIMTDQSQTVQFNDAATGHSVNNLTLESLNLRQVRRGAAGFNQPPQPTR